MRERAIRHLVFGSGTQSAVAPSGVLASCCRVLRRRLPLFRAAGPDAMKSEDRQAAQRAFDLLEMEGRLRDWRAAMLIVLTACAELRRQLTAARGTLVAQDGTQFRIRKSEDALAVFMKEGN